MKKILLALMFTMITNVCFAQVIYTVTDNGFTKNLLTEALKAKVTSKNDQESLFEMTYTLVCVPDKESLAKIRNQTFDNKISFEKQTFTFKCSYYKNSNQWNQDASLWLNGIEFWGDFPERCLYESHGNIPGGAYYGDSSEASVNRNMVTAAYNYVIINKLIEYP